MVATELVDGELIDIVLEDVALWESGSADVELPNTGLVDITSSAAEDAGVGTTARVSATAFVSLLDVPLAKTVLAEVEEVALDEDIDTDHADHKVDEEDDKAALRSVSTVDVEVDVITTVLEVQVVSLAY